MTVAEKRKKIVDVSTVKMEENNGDLHSKNIFTEKKT
jgi:hypothetical protein